MQKITFTLWSVLFKLQSTEEIGLSNSESLFNFLYGKQTLFIDDST
jgi:hypothetical protein